MSSPDTMMTGTLKCPAIAAFMLPSDISIRFSLRLVMLALENVCARTERR